MKSLQEAYSSKIRRIVFPLYNYSHVEKDSNDRFLDSNYVERRNLELRMKGWLDGKDKNEYGSYLVTGFRGMGKTQFVDKVIQMIKDEDEEWSQNVNGKSKIEKGYKNKICNENLHYKKHIFVKINIGNELRSERDILATIVSITKDKFKDFYNHDIKKRRIPLKMMPITIFSFVIGFLLTYALKACDSIETAISIFLALILLAYVFLKYLFPVFLIKITAVHSLLIRMDNLITRIAYFTEESLSINLDVKSKSLFETLRNKSRQPLSVREIEYELSRIITDITDNTFLNIRFIFIFDELDKVNLAAFQTSCTEDRCESKDLQFPFFSYDELSSESGMSQRRKQRCLISLLSQMKFFTSMTKAKFLFIAGHEMYDAHLADISDREFAVSNLFTGIMNIPSFLSSPSSSGYKSVTRMTEAFVCKVLFNSISKGHLDDYKLENISKYYLNKDYYKKLDNYLEKEYLISVLLNFIIYLTFVSNGAPKKITGLFEKYVYSNLQFHDIYPKDEEENLLIVSINGGEKEIDDYLVFGYKDLEKIGFISYMARPVFANIINNDSKYDDRLLVTSLFVILHIFKHSHSGFSWRDLEYIPEFIESSHSPELRKYVKAIFNDMETMSLANMTSGIYSYKFSRSLSEEISYFSRKYEEVSAIFNYSPDYFQSIKNYFYSILSFYKKSGASDAILASLHYFIGDVHLAEEDYNQAVNQYRFSAELNKEALKNSNYIQHPKLIGRYTCSMLKLGMAYEKQSSYDTAFLIYNTLTDELIQFRDINSRKDLHMNGCFIYDKGSEHDKHSERDKGLYYLYDGVRPYWITNGDSQIIIPDIHRENFTNKHKIWAYGDELVDNLSAYLSPEKKKIISRLAVFEDLRLVYLPILAKLSSIEKHNVRGITSSDINLAISEFEFMYKMTDIKSKYLLEVDFYRKLGDIVYYKNKNFYAANNWSDLFATFNIDIRHLITSVMFEKERPKKEIESALEFLQTKVEPNIVKYNLQELRDVLTDKLIEKLPRELIANILDVLSIKINNWNKDPDKLVKCLFECKNRRNTNECSSPIPLPCTACCYFTRSMNVLIKEIDQHQGQNQNQGQDQNKHYQSNVLNFLRIITESNNLSFHQNEILHAALLMSSMGDVMLSCSTNLSKDEPLLVIKPILGCIDNLYENGTIGSNNKEDELDDDKIKLNNTTRAVLYNLAAMRCYERLGEYKHACDSMIRVLKIIIICIKRQKGENNDYSKLDSKLVKLVISIEKYVNRIIKGIYSARGLSSIPEIQRFKMMAMNEEEKHHILLGLSSIMPELEELILAYYELLLEVSAPSIGLLSFLYQSVPLGDKHLSYLSFNRIDELHLKEKVNRIIYESSDLTTIIGTLPNSNIDANLMKKSLVKDSIFALYTILDVLSTIRNGTNYTNIYISEVYNRLFYWIEELNKTNKDSVSENKEYDLLDKENMYKASIPFIKENEDRYMRQAIWMHTEGKEYHKMIEGFYILDDDLQNNTAHFHFALERFILRLMNSEITTLVKVEFIEKKPHSYYKQSSFINHHQKETMAVGDHIRYSRLKEKVDDDLTIPELLDEKFTLKRDTGENKIKQEKASGNVIYFTDIGDEHRLYKSMEIDKVYHFDEFGYLYKIETPAKETEASVSHVKGLEGNNNLERTKDSRKKETVKNKQRHKKGKSIGSSKK